MKRKELLKIMPKTKADSEAAQAITQLGFPMVEPILKDILLWLRVYESPVADIFAKFFAQISPQPIQLIAQKIGTKNETLRNRILVDILPYWPKEAIKQLKVYLTTLSTHPDISNNDIECLRLIIKHDLAEPKWIKQWISFRKKQAGDRINLFEELEKMIELNEYSNNQYSGCGKPHR